MFCGVFVGNSIVHIGTLSPATGARLNRGITNSSRLQSISRHAEMDAQEYFRKHEVRKAQLVVIRQRKDGRCGNSRPCVHCIQRIVRHHDNVSSVLYFDNNQWYADRPPKCARFSKLSSAEEH